MLHLYNEQDTLINNYTDNNLSVLLLDWKLWTISSRSIVLLDFWIQRNNSRQYETMPILDYSTVSRNVFCNNKGAWNQGNKRFEEAFTCTWCLVESTELTRKKPAISKLIPVTYNSDMSCFNGNFKVLPGREGWQSNIWLCMYQYTQNRVIWGSWHAVAMTIRKYEAAIIW